MRKLVVVCSMAVVRRRDARSARLAVADLRAEGGSRGTRRRGRRARQRSRFWRLADVGRHARSQHGVQHEGAAHRVGRQDEEERQMGRRPRLAELRQPVVAGGMVFVGTNNEGVRDKNQAGDRGVLMAFRGIERRVPVAADARETGIGPRQRLAVPGRGFVAAGRGHQALLHQQPRRGLVPRHQRLPRRQERRPDYRREADRRARRRRDLVVRHDGGGRLVPAQHVELVAGHLGRPRSS